MTIADPVLNAAEAALQRRDFDAAEAGFAEWAKANPQSPIGAFGLGVVSEGRGQLDLAAARYRQALAIDPTLVEALFNLGNVEQRLGHIQAAREAFENAARIRPGYDAPVINLALMLMDQGDRAGALAVAKRSSPFLAADSQLHSVIAELQASPQS